jgi:hypothetical protein
MENSDEDSDFNEPPIIKAKIEKPSADGFFLFC